LARKMADNVGPGVLGRRYSEAADEAEHAMSVIGDRLSGSGAGHIIRSAGERRDE
jgi:two-component system, chemotaxis family, protein-glutamate methylesterase/glutaminase